MDKLLFLPIFFPFFIAIIVAIKNFKNKRSRNIFVATSVIINWILIIINSIFNRYTEIHLMKFNSFIHIYFKLDNLGILFGILASTLWIFTSFYSMEYMKHEGKEERFFAFFIFTLGTTVGIAFSGNLLTLYIFYEFLTLVTFPLVIHSETEKALKVGKKYLIYSFGGATLVLLGMILLFCINNNMSFVPSGIIPIQTISNSNLILLIYTLMFLGFGVKAAVVPFHSWLPAAMVAPTPVSSLLHAVAVVKSGIFAIIRVTFFIFGPQVLQIHNINMYLIILVGISILLGSLLALHQENIKKRLAYSTISQLGYILLGIMLLNKNSFVGGLMHLVNHAVIKITLFFCAGAIMYMTGKKNLNEIKGIGKQMPITMWCFSIASISLIGIPPTNGFVSKWYLALGGLNANKVSFVAILLISALLTSGYLLPIVIAAFFSGEAKNNIEKKDPPFKMLFPIMILTFITVFLGFFPNILLNFIENIADKLL